MSFKIVVTGKTTADKAEYVFDKDAISIGRSKACDLTLEDPKQIVGRNHAKIEKRGSSYYVVDMGSRNATYLNKTKIESRSARLLRHGDWLNVGRFTLQFFTLDTALVPETYERTLYDGFEDNPFEDLVAKLRSVLEEIGTVYDTASPGNRDDALGMMLNMLVKELRHHSAGEHVISHLLTCLAEQSPIGEENRTSEERERALHLLSLLLPWLVRVLKRRQKFQSVITDQTVRGLTGFPRSMTGSPTEPEKHLRVLSGSEKDWEAFISGLEDLLAEFEKHQETSYETLIAAAEK